MDDDSKRPSGYPTRKAILRALYEFIRSRTRVDIRPGFSDWTIFEELAGRLSVSAAICKIAHSDGTKMWENDVRWARKSLVEAKVLRDEKDSGYGVWELAPRDGWNLEYLETHALASRYEALNRVSIEEFQSCAGSESKLKILLETKIAESRWW